MKFREAKLNDISQIQAVRRSVKENILSNPDLVTYQLYEEFLIQRGKGWVCETNGLIAGFAVADLKDNNVWALFVRPELEGKGIGRRLHDLMLDWYFSKGKENIWLGTSPKTRAEIFYRKMGWTETGLHGEDEIKFEIMRADWLKRKTKF